MKNISETSLIAWESVKENLQPIEALILSVFDNQPGLKFTRQHITDNPKGSIELSLPIPVQTANKTISRHGVNRQDGSQAVIVELTAYAAM